MAVRGSHKRRRSAARLAAAGGLGMTAALAAPGAANAAPVDFTINIGGDAGDGDCEALPGGCTLRDALVDSSANNNTADVDRILFASSVTGTINVLGAELPQIDEHLNIVGPGAATLTVNGGATYRALFIDAPLATDVTVSGLTLTGHRAADGGALYSLNANLTLDGVTVTASGTTGDGHQGGGIYSINGEVTIRDSTISGNSTAGNGSSRGGGVYAKDGPLTIERSTISGNSTDGAGSDGGGVSSYSGSLTIEDSTISGNSTAGVGNAEGGGIHAFKATPLTIARSTISGNHTSAAGSEGGGVASALSNMTIQSTTLSGNYTTGPGAEGGGVYSGGDVGYSDPILINTIVADSSGAAPAPELSGTNDTFGLSFTLVEDTSGAAIAQTVPGSNLLGVDPQLGPLAANGGPTQTHSLPATSPAADKGSATGTDQRGIVRPFDIPTVANGTAVGANAADMGAFEFTQAAIPEAAECKGKTETVPGNTGTAGPDVIVGTAGADVIRTLGGNDLVCAGAGNDKVIGGPGNDELHGEAGKDTLKGGPGKDKLFGEGGKDRLLGQGGRDRLLGGPGRDRLRGGPGRDKLLGGPGRDRQRQ